MTLKLALTRPGPFFTKRGNKKVETYWAKKFRDPRVKLLIDTTNTPSAFEWWKETRPDVKRVALCDLLFCQCKTIGKAWQAWLRLSPERRNVSPDGFLSWVFETQKGGGWPGFELIDRKYVVAQANDIVIRYEAPKLKRDPYKNVSLMDSLVGVYRDFIVSSYSGVYFDMHPRCLNGRMRHEMGFDDARWDEWYEEFSRKLTEAGVLHGFNSYGPGPLQPFDMDFNLFERFGDQSGGVNVTGTMWDYIAKLERQGIAGGLASLTPKQRSQSILCIQPRRLGDAQSLKLAYCGFAVALMFDIGYVDPFSERRGERPADSLAWYPRLEQRLDLEPIGELEWISQGRGSAMNQFSAQDCVRFKTILRRLFQDSSGKKWMHYLNPNKERRLFLQPEMTRLVRARGK